MSQQDQRLLALRPDSGMTLTEALVAIALLGIVIGSSVAYLSKLNAEVRQENAKNMLQNLGERIQLALSDPDAITNSVTGAGAFANPTLAACVRTGIVCPPGTMSPLTQVPFTLYSAGPAPVPLTGGFNADGDRCVLGAPRCHYSVQTWWWATCPVNLAGVPAASCTEPTYLNFRFRIAYNAPAAGTNIAPRDPATGLPSPPVYPPRGQFDASPFNAFAVRMWATDVSRRVMKKCADDEYFRGLDTNGNEICECVSYAIDASGKRTGAISPITGRPACADQKCPGDKTIAIGYHPVNDPDPKLRGVINCIDPSKCSKNPRPAECPCKDVDLTASGDCGDGFWMVSIEYGECEATTDKDGKGGPEKVKCTKHNGVCCKLDVQ